MGEHNHLPPQCPLLPSSQTQALRRKMGKHKKQLFTYKLNFLCIFFNSLYGDISPNFSSYLALL